MATPVTEQWLGEIGGWQAMKAAREYVRLGVISELTHEGRTYRGLVGSGARKFRATLLVGEGKNAEVRCACPDARRGLVCAHALAVALAALTPKEASSSQAPTATAAGQGTAPASPTPIPDGAIPPGEFTVFISTEHLAAPPSQKPATIPVFLRFQPGGDTRDPDIARWLLERSLPIQSMPLRLPTPDLGSLLGALVNHPRLIAGTPTSTAPARSAGFSPHQGSSTTSAAPIAHSANLAPHSPTILVTNQLHLKTSCKRDITTQSITFQCHETAYVALDPQKSPWLWSPQRLIFASLPADLPPPVLAFVVTLMRTGQATQPLRWVAENLAALCQVIQSEPSPPDPSEVGTGPEAEAQPDHDLLHRLRVIPAQPLFRLRLDGNLRRVEARISTLHPDGVTEAAAHSYPVPDPQNPLLFLTRNPAAERAAQRRLEDAGFKPDPRGAFELKGERDILRLLSSDLPRLRREFQLVEGDGWRHATRGLTIIRPKLRGTGGPPVGVTGSLPVNSSNPRATDWPPTATPDWLTLEVAYEASDGFSVPRSEVLRLIRSGKRDLTGRDGHRYLLDSESCEELEDMVQDMESHFESGNRLAVRSRQAEVLEHFIDRPEVLALHLCPPLDPATLKSRLGGLGDLLRPYQLEGVRWMERHSRTHGGGVLADEMGLGKTVQTLALLRLLKSSSRVPSRALPSDADSPSRDGTREPLSLKSSSQPSGARQTAAGSPQGEAGKAESIPSRALPSDVDSPTREGTREPLSEPRSEPGSPSPPSGTLLPAPSEAPSPPALVICPTSLLSNWAEEAARFTPELRTHISHDTDRHEALKNLSKFDVIFTSYALIVRDLAAYTKLEFSTVVLDEASYIRNPDTATAKAVRQLRARCRFALTGTPVENSVRDLWSIFEFLVPRQLPARDDFEERFVKPLTKVEAAPRSPVEAAPSPLPSKSGAPPLTTTTTRSAVEAAPSPLPSRSGAPPLTTTATATPRPVMERLRRLIRPNLLRRTKREVAKDLPEKIEKILWCDLSAPQREVYQRLLDEGREEIRQARRRSGQGSARMTMFTILLRLRQVCNDLRLVGIQGIDHLSPAETSGKWPVLEELLQETLDGGHKALIFSQFVSMLRLIRAKVQADETPHSYLDGATRDRAGEVAAFQTDPARRLFLISLKAGGYGLNLTAASEVVLVDPWWNPAVEAQAIDRAHRIGQGRPVTAYRLVTRGTVEEKILKLQSQKRAVMDMTLEDDPTVLTGLTDADLEAILE